MMRDVKKLMAALLVVATAVVLAACSSSDDSTTGATGEESAVVTGELTLLADAAAYSKVTGEAELERSGGGTTVSLDVSGLEPKTAYIAHLHTGGCDQTDPGGPHFQFEKGGSEEPPNEIHLKFTADAAGEAEAEATSKREVPPGEAGSVVIHRDDSKDGMSSFEAETPEAETVFVHEGRDHSKEGPGHRGSEKHGHSDKLACAELEGAPVAAGDSPTAGDGDVPTIVVRDGEPVGGVEKLEFDAGEEVRFRVSSDEAEEVHVHGYDLAKDVPAGGTIEFAFPAELEGIYEIELEERAVLIAQLQINP